MPKQTRRVTDQSQRHAPRFAAFARLRRGCDAASRLLALAAFCMTAPPLSAQEGLPTPGEAIGRVFDAVGLRNAPPPAPDFVVKSRGAPLDYKPLQPTDRENHRKPAAELQSIEADMANAAARNKAAASRVAVPDGAAPPVAKPAGATKRKAGAKAQ